MTNAINAITWIPVCRLDDILLNTGTCALVNGEQVAIFRVRHEAELFAVQNYDPISEANVLSRGIIGDIQGQLCVASPIYKQHFNLMTGQCIEESDVRIKSYPVRHHNGCVEVGIL